MNGSDNGFMANSGINVSYSMDMTSEHDLIFPSIFQSVIMWTLPVLIIILNCPVFITVLRTSSLRAPTGYGMISLAITDTGLGFFLIMMNVITSTNRSILTDNTHLCRTEGYFISLFANVSIYTLVFLTVDKWLKFKYPLNYAEYMTRKRSKVALVCIWIFCAFNLALTFVEHFNLTFCYYPHVFLCLPCWNIQQATAIVQLMVVFTLPFLAIIGFHMAIFITVRHQRRLYERRTSIDSNCTKDLQKDIHLAKMLVLMILGFYTAWTPYTILVIGRIITGKCLTEQGEFYLTFLGGSNSCMNPLLYLMFHRSYRHTFLSLFYKMLGYKYAPTSMNKSFNISGMNSSDNLNLTVGAYSLKHDKITRNNN